ncbi:MAG: PspC domain-containing protein [Flavobacteriia bacterium]|nr:PspC domain-containing protein [Flavobacteriia bacterium]PIV96819.1 MAG: PspC domain-containing protein [Flavobacteriaceae bacterium CG17_big_fil_post_rev_8_21_14_2_50_31_13]PIX12695.1 MAG: PspC domain-containing protein [Flavobacteriaceae bacterium CG_4_8_14_3_um_filter_31_8]PIY15042.1 MAG: PspC domain-containing protein [Flavobacteriaceae bacterium CG_4_10_14_3_um_filter_31_253]PIZ11455.1 MAG: PspC domain-containing protein [Flavobacteriaceae bacterium CG_4_10_14_0_8_um_filter_31_99]PJC08
MILGVCEWIGEKNGWRAQNVRIVFVIAFLFAGFGLGLYVILWLVKILSK